MSGDTTALGLSGVAESAASPHRWKTILGCGIIVLAALAAYHNSFHGPFILDDPGSIAENPTIRHLWPIWQALSPPRQGGLTVAGRPLVNLSLAINYAIGRLDVRGYHALNLTIHILAGLTLLGVVRRTLLKPGLRKRFGAAANELALATAVLWTVHPLQTESVTYVIQRAESIMGLFYLLTLYCFIRGADSERPGPWYGLCVAACALGMASKEVMVSAPLMALLYDRAFLSGTFREAWRRRWRVYLALAGTWILLGYLILAGNLGNAVATAKSTGVTWRGYLLTEPGVIVYYLRLSVWPHPLCFDYYGWPMAGTWMSILPPAVVMVVLLGATVCAWRANPAPFGTGPAWGFVGAWFLLILAPTSSVIPLDSPAYEHRMYLALAAVVTMVVLGAFVFGKRLFNEQQGVVLGCVVGGSVVVLFTFLTIQRNRDYNSEVTIWRDAVAKRPNNPRARYNLGNALLQTGKVQDAIELLEQTLRMKPDLAEAHNDLGLALAQLGRLPEAISHWEQALRIKPDYADAHYNLGIALAQLGRLPEAIGHYKQALQIRPGDAEAHNNLGFALVQLGRLQEAIEQWEQALRIDPELAGAHCNLGIVLEKMGRTTEAIGHYQQALRIEPDLAAASNALARLQAVK